MAEKEDIVKNGTDGYTDRVGHGEAHDIQRRIQPAVADPDEEWVKRYIEQFGVPPSFF